MNPLPLRRPARAALVCTLLVAALVVVALLPIDLAAQELPLPAPVAPQRDVSAPAAPLTPPDSDIAALLAEADAAPLDPALLSPDATQRIYLPLASNRSTFAPVPPSPLPQLINPFFDTDGGWTMLQDDIPLSLIVDPTVVDVLRPFAINSRPNVLWLGGIPGGDLTHRAYQSIQLPVDYNVRLLFDYLPQSLETLCGRDTGGLYVNGILLNPRFDFCVDPGVPTNTWREGSADLSPFRGQTVTLEFRMTTLDLLNSNLLIDSLQLCGQHSGLRATEQCPFPGWQEVGTNAARAGGINGSAADAFAPSLAVGQVGRPHAAWATNPAGNYEIHARRWNGLTWEPIGPSTESRGISDTPGASLDPSIALARDGAPWVAWHDLVAGSNEIYVRRWDGSAWIEAGAGSASGRGISNNPGDSFGATLAFAPNGLPYVAWADVPPGAVNSAAEIYVRRFDGAGWVEVGSGSATSGGVSATEGNSLDPSLAIAPNGVVYVAWSEETAGGEEIYVRRFNGTSWIEAGTGSATSGGVSATPGRSLAPSLAAAPDGALWVAWSDASSGDTEIYVRRFLGGVWQEAGSGSASGAGISRNSGSSLDPSLAVSRLGRVYVAWRDQSGFNAEIYALAWTGSAWQSLSSSAVGSGLSNTSTSSAEPAVAVAPDGVPYVVWTDTLPQPSSRGRIYVRRYLP